MPDHAHLLIAPVQDIAIERAVQPIKGRYSHALGALRGRGAEVWQRGFADRRTPLWTGETLVATGK